MADNKGKSPLVVVGSVNFDIVLQVDRLPKAGETLAASSLETFAGGKGANQAAAAAKLGYPTFIVGQVGQDASAAMLQESLRECGVDLSHLKQVAGPSGTALILLQSSGENSIIIVGGANQSQWQLTPGIQQLLQTAGAVLLQREIPEDVNLEVAKVAKGAGVPVFLDAGGVEGPISQQLLACLSLLSPNETELARLTGKPTDTTDQVLEAAGALLEQGVDSVLVKLGSQGSLLLPGRGQAPILQEAFKAARVVDTTGAGDCFTGAYAVAVLQGLSGQQALRFASAAACLCVQHMGAMPSMPHREAVGQLLAS